MSIQVPPAGYSLIEPPSYYSRERRTAISLDSNTQSELLNEVTKSTSDDLPESPNGVIPMDTREDNWGSSLDGYYSLPVPMDTSEDTLTSGLGFSLDAQVNSPVPTAPTLDEIMDLDFYLKEIEQNQ